MPQYEKTFEAGRVSAEGKKDSSCISSVVVAAAVVMLAAMR